MVRDYVNLGSSGNREIDKNGFMRVKNCVVTKSEVNQYRGDEVPEWQRLGLDPNRIYNVLRPAEEIEKSLKQMRGLPILEDHDDVHDAEHPKQYMRIGAMGTQPEFREPEVRTDLTFWNRKEIDEINSGRRDNLSMGYDYVAILENGEYDGQKYQIRMKDIVWNHVALVDKGRVEGAKVSDRAIAPFFQEDRKVTKDANGNPRIFGHAREDIKRAQQRQGSPGRPVSSGGGKKTATEEDRKMLQKHGVAGLRRMRMYGILDRLGIPAKDGEVVPETPVGVKKKPGTGRKIGDPGKYEDTRKPDEAMGRQLGKRVAGDKLPRAGSHIGDQTMGTRKKRNGDAEPAAGGLGEEIEEIQENRVIAGMKALLDEFENIHEEQGIDPGVTDEEAGCLEKVRDFLDSFHNQGRDEPGEEAGTSMDPMDEDPEFLENGEVAEGGAEDENWPDNGSSPKGRGSDRAMDAALIEKRITDRFRAKDRALDECSELLGSPQKVRVLDSASAIYAHTLKTNGIKVPGGVNLEGLRGMVLMLKKARVGDSLSFVPPRSTGIDAQVQETISKSPYAPRQ